MQLNWRKAISEATLLGIPAGALSSSLAYYDSMRTEVLPANLLQGQRDYFGAHTFEKISETSGKIYHIEWSSENRDIITIS